MNPLVKICILMLLSGGIISCGGGGSGGGAGDGDADQSSQVEEGSSDEGQGDTSESDSSVTSEKYAALRDLALQNGHSNNLSLNHAAVTPDEDPLVALGEQLFFSKTLSGNFDAACASCHHPDFTFSDGMALPVGVEAKEAHTLGPGRIVDPEKQSPTEYDNFCLVEYYYCGPNMPRNSPTIINSALYKEVMFFDGRVERLADGTIRTPESGTVSLDNRDLSLLEIQALFPVINEEEMRGNGFDTLEPEAYRDVLVGRLKNSDEPARSNWKALFDNAFGNDGQEWVSYLKVQKALAAYESGLTLVDTPWSDFLYEQGELTEGEIRGAQLFFAPTRDGGLGCSGCHSGDFFTDEDFHNVGFPQIGRGTRADHQDLGRGSIVRSDGSNDFAFRTPSLINVSVTAPYGHSGIFQTLDSLLRYHANPDTNLISYLFDNVEQFYADGGAGGVDALYPYAKTYTETALGSVAFAADKLPMRDLGDQELADLKAFLGTLTDPCASSTECLNQWLPSPEDDPDGNMLIRGVVNNSGTAGSGPTLFEYQEGPFSLSSLSTHSLATFPELAESCGYQAQVMAEETGFVSEDVTSTGLSVDNGFHRDTWFNGGHSVLVEPTMFAGGVAPVYLNDDCLIDLFYVAGDTGGLVYYTQNPDFSFSTLAYGDEISALGMPLGTKATSAVAADLNGDYQVELVLGNLVAAYDGSGETIDTLFDSLTEFNVSILGKGDPSSVKYSEIALLPSFRNTYGVGIGDANKDGLMDIALGHWGTFAADDGAPVLFVQESAEDGGQYVVADSYANLTFDDGLPRGRNFVPTFWDIDLDGDQDMTITGDFGTSSVLQSDASPSFSIVTDRAVITDENAMGTAIGDYDNDGDQDWFVTSVYDANEPEGNWGTTGNRLYNNQSSGQEIVFSDVTEGAGVRDGGWGWGACFADFNNDGWLDIFHENGFGYIPDSIRDGDNDEVIDKYRTIASEFLHTSPRLFINSADPVTPSFKDLTSSWGLEAPTNGRGVICNDIDRDGDVDIISFEHSGKLKLYRNKNGASAGKRFVSIRLIGKTPNTEAVGARVYVAADTDGNSVVEIAEGERQFKEVMRGSNFSSQSGPDEHFGLGSAEEIGSITIEWPDGSVSNCSDLAVNQFYVFDQRLSDQACQLR